MKNHHRAMKAAFAGLLMATIFGAGSASARVYDPQCVTVCRQVRRACQVECAADAGCGMQFKVGRAQCIVNTVPGGPRQGCLDNVVASKTSCQVGLKDCKAGCVQDFTDCRSDCSVQ